MLIFLLLYAIYTMISHSKHQEEKSLLIKQWWANGKEKKWKKNYQFKICKNHIFLLFHINSKHFSFRSTPSVWAHINFLRLIFNSFRCVLFHILVLSQYATAVTKYKKYFKTNNRMHCNKTPENCSYVLYNLVLIC